MPSDTVRAFRAIFARYAAARNGRIRSIARSIVSTSRWRGSVKNRPSTRPQRGSAQSGCPDHAEDFIREHEREIVWLSMALEAGDGKGTGRGFRRFAGKLWTRHDPDLSHAGMPALDLRNSSAESVRGGDPELRLDGSPWKSCGSTVTRKRPECALHLARCGRARIAGISAAPGAPTRQRTTPGAGAFFDFLREVPSQ